MNKIKPHWHIEKKDVDRVLHSSTSSGRFGDLTKSSRAADVRSITVVLRHHPTGVSVSGDIPTGHYSRPVMKKLREKLEERLFTELGKAVARHLRIPGQTFQ